MRRATQPGKPHKLAGLFLSTLSLRRATTRRASRQQPAGISIHALLAESDTLICEVIAVITISIHALLAESDDTRAKTINRNIGFLSTLSLRRATNKPNFTGKIKTNFYPRSPCGERHLRVVDGSKSSIISIHALLAESDHSKRQTCADAWKFLSTLSLRRATDSRNGNLTSHCNFYPRSPCGERQPATSRNNKNNVFLSTLSLRRATYQQTAYFFWTGDFYPRSPCGERQREAKANEDRYKFLSTLSLRRATANGCATVPNFRHFYPRSPCGERHKISAVRVARENFYPRSPCGERPVQIVIIVVDALISIHALLAESDSAGCNCHNAHPISIHALLAESD